MPHRPPRTFSPGFRLSAVDVLILLGGGAATAAVGRVDGWVGLAVAFVVGHFFLFCNVLRLSRRPELVWAGVFATLAIVATVPRAVSCPVVFVACGGLTVVLAIRESRRPSYHGVGWRWLNPRLPAWWSAAGDGQPSRSARERPAGGGAQ
jgi:hypothetical protein